MSTSTATSKGQTTIPADIRKVLNIKTGTKISYSVMPDGDVRMRTKRYTLDDITGIIPNQEFSPRTIEEINEGIAIGATSRYLRYLNQDKT